MESLIGDNLEQGKIREAMPSPPSVIVGTIISADQGGEALGFILNAHISVHLKLQIVVDKIRGGESSKKDLSKNMG
jgi:hypothetical protein